MGKDDKNPTPIESGEGQQMDDNTDDLGRRPDGTRQDQPCATKPSKSDNGPTPAAAVDFEGETADALREEDDATGNPNPLPMDPAFTASLLQSQARQTFV